MGAHRWRGAIVDVGTLQGHLCREQEVCEGTC